MTCSQRALCSKLGTGEVKLIFSSMQYYTVPNYMCYFTLSLHHIPEGNPELFTPLHVFDSLHHFFISQINILDFI